MTNSSRNRTSLEILFGQEEPTSMHKDDLIAFLRDNLRIEVETKSEYTGGMNGSGSLYSDSHTLKLVLSGEVISEVYL